LPDLRQKHKRPDRAAIRRFCPKSKRPDRVAIRASCVTIARQPPWILAASRFRASHQASGDRPQGAARQEGLEAKPDNSSLSRTEFAVSVFIHNPVSQQPQPFSLMVHCACRHRALRHRLQRLPERL